VQTNHNGYRGDGFVNTVNTRGASIRYQVEADEANNFRVKVRYANGGLARGATLVVNNNEGTSASYEFDRTGDWDTWGEESRDVVLTRGRNVIELVAANGDGLPNIDSISIVGNGASADDCGNSSNGSSDSNSNSGSNASDSGSGNNSSSGDSGNSGAVASGRPSTVIRLSDSVPGWAGQGGGTSGGGRDSRNATTVSSFGALNSAASGSGSKIILLTPGTYRGNLSIGSNKTIIGTAPGVLIRGTVRVSGSDNVIVRNVAIQGERCSDFEACRRGDDAVYIGNGATNVWFDHVDVYDGQDGNFDITKGANYVTCSWCRFRYTSNKPHAFSNLIAGSDSETQSRGKLKTSFMYSWWGAGVEQRAPRGRFGDIHVVNNLYTSQVSSSKLYAIGPGVDMAMVIENNVFKMASQGRAIKLNSYGDWRGVLARGNIGSARDAINVDVGRAFTVPYRYDLRPAREVESMVRTRDGGAGNTVVFER